MIYSKKGIRPRNKKVEAEYNKKVEGEYNEWLNELITTTFFQERAIRFEYEYPETDTESS